MIMHKITSKRTINRTNLSKLANFFLFCWLIARMAVVPYQNDPAAKKQQVARMFDNISGKYDLLNHTLSLGIDRLWRKRAIRELQAINPRQVLDVATGTGDFAIAALAANPEKVVGVDISEGMLEVGREKLKRQKLDGRIELRTGDSENLPFPDNSFDAVMAAFGVRNFENLLAGLTEMQRVMRPGGKLIILEFSKPRIFPFKQIYQAYFHFVLPKIGRWVSRDQAAYTYLPESVNAFPDGQAFTDILVKAGFHHPKAKPLTFGISTLYTAGKA
jgi:demethylmenaquinone methyltransferase/2-methoxy-6-polyprenyl-1,4-benzoquinol methylase